MAFMDFLPQFGDNMDQSGVDDPTLQAINLKRKLALADSLRNQAAPQGQMVSGHYVRPSWTQSLAHGVNQYLANSTENAAIKNYADAQKTQQAKMADVLKNLTPHTEEVQLDVNQAGGMPGVMQTQQVKPDINAAIQGLTQLNPEFGAKLAESRISKALTPKEPIKIGAGETLLNTETMQPLYTAPNKPAIEKTPQIQQLLAYQKTLDPKSPDYKIIGDAIKKESTFAPNAASMPVDMNSARNLSDLIGQNKVPPLSGFAMRSPFGQTVMSMVQEKYPNYTSADIGGIKKSVADFSTGKTGNTVRSLNVAVNHLDTLGQLSEALNNNDINMFNKIGNTFAQQTGNPIPTNFNAAKKIVADEIVKGIMGSGGGVADREEAAATINAANSPAQLKGVIDTYKQLLGGQLSGLKQQYEVSTGKKDFNKFISPNTQKNIGDHSQTSQPSSIRSAADAILGGP
jgi:hypothetical protein